MKRKTAVLTVSYLCALALGLGGFGWKELRRAEQAERELRYAGEHAFEELCAAVRGMDTALEKSLYAVSPALRASMCAEVSARAGAAEAALGALPFASGELEQTASFLSRTGDYALWALRCTAAGEETGEEVGENLRALSEAASALDEGLNALRLGLADGSVTADGALALRSGLPGLSDSLLQMESEFPETPSLVYDGPFSSALADRPPRMTENAREISEEDAVRIAAGFLGLRSNLATPAGETEGAIPGWRLSAGDFTVTVSRQGGFVVRCHSERTPRRAVLSTEEALAAAGEFLRTRAASPMKESYHIREENVLTVSYCGEEQGVFCYPDMVKLTVALDTGEILHYDAEAYLTSHTRRQFPRPEITAEAAEASLPSGLRLLSDRLALIPSAGQEELFCRELICEGEEGRHYLFYVNAVTGAQERILILLEDENGTLAL